MNIEDMRAGPELNELVGKKVMGWSLGLPFTIGVKDPRMWTRGPSLAQSRERARVAGSKTALPIPPEERSIWFSDWHPSTDDAHALDVVKKLKSTHNVEMIWDVTLGMWRVMVGKSGPVLSKSLAYAVCIAALRTVMG